MPEASPKLSNTTRTVLTLAAARADHLVRVPQLPVAAARQVIRSLLNAGLTEEIPATVEDADFAWRVGDDGVALMLRATAAGLACVTESAPGEPRTWSVADREDDKSEINTPVEHRGDATDGAGAANPGERNQDAPTETVQIDAGIAPLVNAFVQELVKNDRAPYVAAFLRRLEGGGVARGTEATGTRRTREMSVSQRKIVELCSRPDGATGKELAEGCGWPSIAARTTCQKIADRFGYVLHESPKGNGRGISFRMTAKPAVEA